MKRKLNQIVHQGKKYLVLDTEAFDWEVEEAQLNKIKLSVASEQHAKERFVESIINHFVDSFSEFLGKKVTLKQINDAIEQEYIEL